MTWSMAFAIVGVAASFAAIVWASVWAGVRETEIYFREESSRLSDGGKDE